MHRAVKKAFCTLLRQIWTLYCLREIQISISDAYFSAVETETHFFNRIGQKQPLECVYETGGDSFIVFRSIIAPGFSI